MKIQYLIIAGILLINCTVEATNPGTKRNEAELARVMQSLDRKAAASGDKLAMSSVANACLTTGDYMCAYENILISLTSLYWWTDLKLPNHVLEIHDKARDALSDQEAETIMEKVKLYFAEEVKKKGKQVEDNMADKDPAEWEKLARQGKIIAAGHLAKKYLSEENYSATYVWATIASMGAVWQTLGENMLSYRDQARKHMNQIQMQQANEEIQNILLGIKYPGKTL